MTDSEKQKFEEELKTLFATSPGSLIDKIGITKKVIDEVQKVHEGLDRILTQHEWARGIKL
jgi:hypothetical protein